MKVFQYGIKCPFQYWYSRVAWCSVKSTVLPPLCPGFDSVLDSVLNTVCGLSLLVPFSSLRGFSWGCPVFPSYQKPWFDLISCHSRWFEVSSINKAGKNFSGLSRCCLSGAKKSAMITFIHSTLYFKYKSLYHHHLSPHLWPCICCGLNLSLV